MLDKAYFYLDEGIKGKISVELRAKDNNYGGSENLAKEFLDSLIDIAFFKSQQDKSRVIREEILKRALFTNMKDEEKIEDDFDLSELDEEFMEDVEEIRIPWEEKNKDAGKRSRPKPKQKAI